MGKRILAILLAATSAIVAGAQSEPKFTSAEEALASARGTFDPNPSPYTYVAQRVAALLIDEEFEALELIAKEYRDSKARWDYSWWKLTSFYDGMLLGRLPVTPTSQPVPFLQRFEHWVDAHPESVTAKIALARARQLLASQARGTGWAHEVDEAGWAGMRRHLEAAWQVLEEAEALGQNDPELYTVWLRVGNGLSKSREVMDQLYEKGIEIEPGYPTLYQARAFNLMPRWGGGPGELEAFAERAAEDGKAVPGTGAYFWVVQKIDQLTETTTFINRFEWSQELLRESFADLLAEYPDSLWIQNHRAHLSCLIKDKEEAKKAFAVIERDFEVAVWPDKYVYGRWKRWAENDAQWPGGNRLHYAVRWDDPNLCRAYLAAGESLDATDEFALTPLHYAAKMGMTKAAGFLIEQGAQVDSDKGPMVTPLHTAASAGRDNMVKLLLDHGADPNSHTKLHGSSPLITAAAYSRRDAVKVLLEHPDIDVNIQDKQGQSAIYYAGARGNVAIIKLLLNAGADVNLRAKSGETALYWAKKNKRARAIKVLEANGATL